MLKLHKPILETVAARYSCRTYQDKELLSNDVDFMKQCSQNVGILFSSKIRIQIIDHKKLQLAKRIGTYGFIKNPQLFIASATLNTKEALVDFGYALEQLVLAATERGIGTCWLGGTFTKEGFLEIMRPADDEILPAVISLGYPDEKRFLDRLIRYNAGSDTRLKAEQIFFDTDWGNPYKGSEPYTTILELVRLAPSASNNQPWRVLYYKNAFHFYLQRTPGYFERNKRLFGLYDLQMIDMGIAVCHFQYGVLEYGVKGEFAKTHHPAIECLEYIISFLQ